MPNWCYTNITMSGQPDNVKWLRDKVEEWTSENLYENGFGKNWLGNIVIGAELASYDEICNGDPNKIEQPPNCRGSLVYMDIDSDNTSLTISTETAWTPKMNMWRMINDQYNLGLEIIYYAEEPGIGIFVSNDPTEVGYYLVNVYEPDEKIVAVIGDDGFYEHCTEDYVVSILQRILDVNITDINRLLSLFEESDYSCCMSIHTIEYADVEEWE